MAGGFDFGKVSVLVPRNSEKIPCPLQDVIRDKRLLLVYVGASWCPYSKKFNEMLLRFYDVFFKQLEWQKTYVNL